jgi:hypothetical protein
VRRVEGRDGNPEEVEEVEEEEGKGRINGFDSRVPLPLPVPVPELEVYT